MAKWEEHGPTADANGDGSEPRLLGEGHYTIISKHTVVRLGHISLHDNGMG